MEAAIGRIVHYQHSDGADCRPAIIVRVWSVEPNGAVQLQVFNDADKDGTMNDRRPPMEWATSVTQGTGGHHWHSHEDCPNA